MSKLHWVSWVNWVLVMLIISMFLVSDKSVQGLMLILFIIIWGFAVIKRIGELTTKQEDTSDDR